MRSIRLPASPRSLSLLGLVLALLAMGSVPSPSAAYTIEPGHPRLYFTAADLPALRARTGAQWQTLQNWQLQQQPTRELEHATYSGRDATRTHQFIERYAFMYLMLAVADPVTANKRAEVARAWLMELATYSFAGNPNDAFEYIWALAIGYDWLFTWSGFSEADKQIVRTQLLARTSKQVNETGLNGFPAFPTGPETSKSIYDNMSTENNMVSGFAGLALWEAGDPHGTNGQAQTFLDATYYRFREMYAATRAHAPDGGYWEGQGYCGARLQGEVFFAWTWLVATGEDLLAGNEHLKNAVYYWIYGLRPDGVSSREGDQTCLPKGCARNRHIAYILAAYHGDPYLQWYAQYLDDPPAGAGWEEVALYDPTLLPQPPSTLPLYRRFQFGHIVIRTGWDIGFGSDDTYFTFDIHDWVSGHTHVDSGSFTLFRRGALAIDSGRYRGDNVAHERNYATRTVAHNTVTVYRAGEDFGAFANDGGQTFLFQETPITEPRFVADLAPGTLFDAGTLEAFEASADHYYLKGNITDAYHSTGYQRPSDGAAAKISNFTREIALFPDEPDPLVVVFDRVTSLQASWPKRWLLHAIEEPEVSGPVTSTEVAGHIFTHGGDLVTIDHGGGRLFSRTLLPASPRIRKVGGAGYEFWVDDPGANYPLSVVDPEAGAWRVEVRPSTAATADTFLNVFSVTTDGVPAMPATRLIDAGTAYGAEAGDRVVLFAKTSTPVQNVAYTVEADGPIVRHLLTGMLPGVYAVTRNSVPVSGSPFTSSGDKTIAFQTPGGGSVSATWLSGQADLVVTGLTGVPAGANPGASVTVSDTVANKGSATAGASAMRYYLSVDTVLGPSDILVPATRQPPVPTLTPGAISAGSATLTVPAGAPHDLYFVLACADGAGAVGENNEGNNCRASGPMRVGVADLAVTEVTNPPANIRAGLAFQLIATVGNFGTAVSGASTLRFYLSLNAARDAADVLLTGSRAVPALIPGAQASSLTSVTVPVATPPGFYYLLACADWGGVVVESDELDNCLASASTMEVRVPDLVVTSATVTPSAVAPGSKLTVSDTTHNQGIVDAVASKTRYYLSTDTVIGANDKLLTGSRPVPLLAAGASSSGTVTVTIPSTTAVGPYFVLACADDMKTLGEVSETNNCRAAAVTVGTPELVVDAADHVEATVQRGKKLTVTDTTRNKGTAPTGKTTRTRYYLSLNKLFGAGDKLLTGYRPVLNLAPNTTSTGGVKVTVPTSTIPGDYFLLACADDTALLVETSETNNCGASDTPVTVVP